MSSGTVSPPRILPITSDRSKFLGASDVAAVMGLSKFRTPLAVYLQKRGEAPETPTSEVMEWGNRLEEPVRQAYSDKVLRDSGLTVVRGDMIGRVQHPEIDWMVCSPDGVVCLFAEYADGPTAWRYGLECKTADRSVAHLWGESGTDQVPDAYALQCHFSMHVTGLERWDVAVLIGGNDFRTYTLRRDEVLLSQVLPELEAFWQRVQKGDPPEPMGADNALMNRLFHQTREELVEGDEAVDILAVTLRDAKAAHAAVEDEVNELEARLKAKIGERAGAQGPWGRILWKQNRPSEVVDYKGLVQMLKPTPKMLASHTSTKQGARPFRTTFAGGAL